MQPPLCRILDVPLQPPLNLAEFGAPVINYALYIMYVFSEIVLVKKKFKFHCRIMQLNRHRPLHPLNLTSSKCLLICIYFSIPIYLIQRYNILVTPSFCGYWATPCEFIKVLFNRSTISASGLIDREWKQTFFCFLLIQDRCSICFILQKLFFYWINN